MRPTNFIVEGLKDNTFFVHLATKEGVKNQKCKITKRTIKYEWNQWNEWWRVMELDGDYICFDMLAIKDMKVYKDEESAKNDEPCKVTQDDELIDEICDYNEDIEQIYLPSDNTNFVKVYEIVDGKVKSKLENVTNFIFTIDDKGARMEHKNDKYFLSKWDAYLKLAKG